MKCLAFLTGLLFLFGGALAPPARAAAGSPTPGAVHQTSSPAPCNDEGLLVYGKCFCRAGFSGATCANKSETAAINCGSHGIAIRGEVFLQTRLFRQDLSSDDDRDRL